MSFMPDLWRDLMANKVAASPFMPFRLRMFIYRRYGLTIGAGSCVCPRCFVGNRRVSIGNNTYINTGCFLDKGPLVIGSDCSIGMEVMFCTTTHESGVSSHRAGPLVQKSIIVGDGCWIGARAIILPGIAIGSGCVIGAGAIVTKNCESDGLYCGNPARLIRKLGTGEIRERADCVSC